MNTLTSPSVSTVGAPERQRRAIAAAAPDTAESLPHAAKGDDDLMSLPPAGQPFVDVGVSGWKRQIGRAKRTWSKLSGEDLVKVDGDMEKLADLLRQKVSRGPIVHRTVPT